MSTNDRKQKAETQSWVSNLSAVVPLERVAVVAAQFWAGFIAILPASLNLGIGYTACAALLTLGNTCWRSVEQADPDVPRGKVLQFRSRPSAKLESDEEGTRLAA